VDEGCGATNAGAAEGVHQSRAVLELLQCVGAVPENGILQAAPWPVVFTALNSLSVIQHQHSRRETQLSIAQRLLSDLQEFAVDAQKFRDKANALRAERDHILQALNFVHHTLDSRSAVFDSSSVDFFPSVQAFVSTVHSCLPAQHLCAADERDQYFAANIEYAKHLRSVNAENARLITLLSKPSPSTTDHPI
jgi:hypothetical protein